MYTEMMQNMITSYEYIHKNYVEVTTHGVLDVRTAWEYGKFIKELMKEYSNYALAENC
jgi:hypothetical protein